MALRPCLPVSSVNFILGNDIAGGTVYPAPQVVDAPLIDRVDDLVQCHPNIFPVSVVTRSQKCKQTRDVDLSDSFFASVLSEDNLLAAGGPVNSSPEEGTILTTTIPAPVVSLPLTWEALIRAQKGDPFLTKCYAAVVEDKNLYRGRQYFCLENDVLIRKWVPQPGEGADEAGEDWGTVQQIVLLASCQEHVLALAHEHLWSGHLGVTKTYTRMLKHFFWPGMKADVVRFCKMCHTCQLVGKPNQVVPSAPLHPIPVVGEPFEHVLVDCVGPLPKTKTGNQYMLTIMCVATRFPETVLLWKITASAITKTLEKFFTIFGIPKVVQMDQGTKFLSSTFRQTLHSLGITHSVSSAYHPESQGVLKCWHQTLKSMLSKYCHETGKNWDEGVPFVLFAIRDAKQESLGFSPAELVFGHVCGPLKVLKECFMADPSSKTNVVDFVFRCRERLKSASVFAREALSASQEVIKKRYDRKAVERQFQPRDKVLVLFPVSGSALSARFTGPYVVKSKVSDTDYIILIPERGRKNRLCPINMLKLYHSRETEKEEQEKTLEAATPDKPSVSMSDDMKVVNDGQLCGRLSNSVILSDIEGHLSYLPDNQRFGT